MGSSKLDDGKWKKRAVTGKYENNQVFSGFYALTLA